MIAMMHPPNPLTQAKGEIPRSARNDMGRAPNDGV